MGQIVAIAADVEALADENDVDRRLHRRQPRGQLLEAADRLARARRGVGRSRSSPGLRASSMHASRPMEAPSRRRRPVLPSPHSRSMTWFHVLCVVGLEGMRFAQPHPVGRPGDWPPRTLASARRMRSRLVVNSTPPRTGRQAGQPDQRPRAPARPSPVRPCAGPRGRRRSAGSFRRSRTAAGVRLTGRRCCSRSRAVGASTGAFIPRDEMNCTVWTGRGCPLTVSLKSAGGETGDRLAVVADTVTSTRTTSALVSNFGCGARLLRRRLLAELKQQRTTEDDRATR